MQRAGILEAVDLLPQSHGDQIARIGRRRIAQNQDGTADAAAAELHGLLQIGDGKELRAQLTQMAADGHGTVAVCICFDYCHYLCFFADLIHGIFDMEGVTDVIVKALAKKKGITLEKASGMDLKSFKEEQYDKLADGIRSHLDMERIYEIMKENVEEK